MPINEKYRVLGVMSGTSLDGIDLAICTFTKDTNWKFKIEKSETLEYTYYWKKTLSELHTRSESFISEINNLLSNKLRALFESAVLPQPKGE